MFTDQTARATSRNLAATHRAGMRTGLREAPAPGAVTVWCGPGPTKLPHNLPQPVQHPEPSNVDPALVKAAAVKERCAQRQLANQRRRNQRAARKTATVAAQPAAPVAPAKTARKPLRIAACTFDNSRYLRSHGKAPRGTGTWLFERKRGVVFFQHTGTLAAAKAAAKAYAKSQGYGTTATGCLALYVCP